MNFKISISAIAMLLMGSAVYAQDIDTTKTKELKEVTISGTVNTYKQAQNTITGKVFDKETKEALPGVPVYIPGTTIGTTTSANGEFTLTSEQSFDSIEVKFVGYQTQ